MAIYMKVPGVKGNVTEEGHKDWIVLSSLSFNAARNVAMEVGNVANRQDALPMFTELQGTKPYDLSSGGLLQKAIGDPKGMTIEIEICETGSKGKGNTYMKYKLEKALFSLFSSSATESEPPYESFSISYTKITVEFTEFKSDGSQGGKKVVGFDLETSKSF